MMQSISPNLRTTIAGSSAGTLIEWYDFFLYGALASHLAKVFFSNLPASSAYLFSLLTFAAGFLVRPLGAMVFGIIGDRWGRKNTFLLTMLLMGLSTITVGLIPSYQSIGIWAPIFLILARLVQGLAVGGEYGGAATFIAEHAPANRRGYATSFIQLTCTLGLALALAAVVLARFAFSKDYFETVGWRIPFLASVILLLVAYWIRKRLDESPMFKERREANSLSNRPLVESFRGRKRITNFLLATFALCGGMTVIFYTSQFYVLTFMTKSALVSDQSASLILLAALLLAIPAFPLVGWLSDVIGRKKVILAGFILAGVSYFFLFNALGVAVNGGLFYRSETNQVTVYADEATCNTQINLITPAKPTTFCDIARSALSARGVPYRVANVLQSGESLTIGASTRVASQPGEVATKTISRIQDALNADGFPKIADESKISWSLSIFIVWLMVLYVALAYAPLAAALAEMFPTEIRYTSLSFSYNLSVGWIGGLLPSIAYALVLATGQPLFGIWYPVIITLTAAAITLVFVKDHAGSDITVIPE